MKTTQRGFIVPLVLVIIALLLVGSGAYVYVQNRQVKQLEIVNQASATSKGQVTDSQTAGWKTYTSKEYGFEMQYPADWVLESSSGSLPTLYGKNYILQIFSETPQGSLEKNIAYLNARAGRTIISSEDAISIGNGKAFYSLESVPGDDLPTAWLVGKNNILQMQMTAVYPQGSDNTHISSQQGEPLFKEILSTFRFNQ